MSLFSINSKLYATILWIRNIFILNLCWLLFSLPVVTIGAATVAAYDVAFKMMSDTEGYIFKNFRTAFAANWKQGTVLWLITAAAAYALYLDAQILRAGDPSIPVIIVSIVSFVAVSFSLLYAYPLCARYQNKLPQHIKNSFLLSTQYFGRTLFLIAILAVEIFIFFWNTKTMILVPLIGPVIFIYTVAGTAKRVFLENDKHTHGE